MELSKLEQEKIALTKQYEKILQEINSYTFWKIVSDSGQLKELKDKKDAIEYRIKEIKKALENN